jgi:signal peptidase II
VIVVTFVAFATIAIDAATKRIVSHRLTEGRLYQLTKHCGVRLTYNRSAILLGLSPVGAAGASVAILGCAFALALRPTAPGVTRLTALGMVIGGATGNLVDKVRRRSIVDFLVVGWWPAFNFADATIVIGIVLVLGALR